MNLKKCILTKNECYIKGTKIKNSKPTGIVVHSTGANNPNVKRYVQPLKTDKNYKTIISDLGKNTYDNDWNRSGIKKCVHAFIGKNAKGNIVTYQTLPFDLCCWGVGAGKKGSYNYNPHARIQFEICEDGLNDKAYFNKVFKEAIEFCVYLCRLYDLDASQICSHQESYLSGYGGNHGDCDYWLKKFGKDMNWLRAEVNKLLKKSNNLSPTLPSSKKGIILEWQKSAIADGFSFSKYGADGKWGDECVSVAKKAIIKKRDTYKYRNLTKIVQRVVGVTVDGKCGKDTDTAIRKYQKIHGLTVDGVVGSNSWKVILGIK